jgi:hypothetical protein
LATDALSSHHVEYPVDDLAHRPRGPVAQGLGKCHAITRHAASVRSVWYRVTARLCCCRVAVIHKANPSGFKKPFGIAAGANGSTVFKNCR